MTLLVDTERISARPAKVMTTSTISAIKSTTPLSARPEAGRSRPPPEGVKQSGRATFA
jgi:hypothetical protein